MTSAILPNMGVAPYCGGAAQTDHLRHEIDGGEVSCQTEEAFVPDVEDLFEALHTGPGGHGFLCGPDRDVQSAVRPADSSPSPPEGRSF